MALVAPGLGALFLGVAGVAWLGLGWGHPSFLRPELLVPGVLSSAGALMAIVAKGVDSQNGRFLRSRPEHPSPPDRYALPGWPGRPSRPIRVEPEDRKFITRQETEARAAGTALKQTRARVEANVMEHAKARAEANARKESRARAEAFFNEFSRLVDQNVAASSGTRGDALPSNLDALSEFIPDRNLVDPAPLVSEGQKAIPARTAGWIEIAVLGAQNGGPPLDLDLEALGGTFIRAASTTPHYALYALPDTTPPKLALLRNGSTAVELVSGRWMQLASASL